jgi:hypothetical protein
VQQFAPLEELFSSGVAVSTGRSWCCACAGYLSFKLGYRDLVAMMAEREIELAHTRYKQTHVRTHATTK